MSTAHSFVEDDFFGPTPDANGEFATPAEGAKFMALMGIPQTPLHGKDPFLKDFPNRASTDFEQIDAWYAQHNCNFGSVMKAEVGGFFAMETDSNIPCEQFKQETGSDLTARLVVKSGPDRAHWYYRHDEESLNSLSNIGQTAADGFSLRSKNLQCVSPGSIHPERKTQYAILKNLSSPTPASNTEINWWKSKRAQKKKDEVARDSNGLIPHGLIHDVLVSQTGKLVAMNLSQKGIEEALLDFAHNNCAPPLDEARILQVARSTSNWAKGNPLEDIVLVGGKLAGSTGVSVIPMDLKDGWRTRFCTVGQLRKGKIPMLIEGFLPGGVTFFGGLPGEAKTWLALSVAKALTNTSNARLFLDKYHVPAIVPVIYLIPESGDEAFRTRCEKFGIPDDEKLFLCRTITAGKMLLSDSYLLEAVRQLKPLVVMDTLIRFNEAESENEAMQNQKLTEDITALRQAGAAGVLALHHATKALREGEMSQENVLRGTGDLAASADAIWGMRRDSSLWNNGNGPSEIDVVCVKPRDMDPAPLPFRIAITRRAQKQIPGSVVGFQSGIESVIDAEGDIKICRNTTAQDRREANAARDAKIVELITSNPSMTVQTVALEIDEPVSTTGRLLKNLGWHKPNGVWTKKPILVDSDAHVTPD